MHGIRRLFYLLVALLLFPFTRSVAADCVDYGAFMRTVGRINLTAPPDFPVFDNFASDIVVVGNYAYITVGADGLKVVDITLPDSPVIVGEIDTPGSANGVAVAGNFAYVADGNTGLVRIDITTPASPVVGVAVFAENANKVVVSGNYAYVTSWNGWLTVVDIATAGTMTVAAHIPVAGPPGRLTISGNYAYIAAGSLGLHVVNIANPNAPFVNGSVDTHNNAAGVAVSGSYAYVGDGYMGVYVMDVSNPFSPTEVTRFYTGNSDFHTNAAADIKISGNYAYVANGYGLRVLDISTPTSLKIAGEVACVGASAYTRGVALSGGHAYLINDPSTTYQASLQIVDIAPPTSPKSEGAVGMLDNALGLAVSGNYAYVADASEGLHVVNVTNPASPTIVGTVNTPGGANDVAVSGNYAYVADWDSGLHVVNISSPVSPVIVGSVNTPGQAIGVALSGNYAYVADHFNGLQIVDISSPVSPANVANVDTPHDSWDVAISGNYAYVADYLGGLQVVDISTPSSPAIVGSLDLPNDGVWGVAISGNYAYLADNYYGLRIADITVPASPVLVSGLPMPSPAAQKVAVAGNYVYVADDIAGLQVVGVSNPASPLLLGSIPMSYKAIDVVVSGAHVYIADSAVSNAWFGSLTIVPAQREQTVPVLITRFSAAARARDVVITWDLQSDENLESFTLYRRDNADARPAAIAQGAYDGTVRSHVDDHVVPGKTYYYELVIRTQAGGDIRSLMASATVPSAETALTRSYPNPFKTRTSIEYTLSTRSRVTVGIYDAAGRLVARLDDGERDTGAHRVEWNGRDVTGNAVGSGVYFYRLEGIPGAAAKKMIRLK